MERDGNARLRSLDVRELGDCGVNEIDARRRSQ